MTYDNPINDISKGLVRELKGSELVPLYNAKAIGDIAQEIGGRYKDIVASLTCNIRGTGIETPKRSRRTLR